MKKNKISENQIVKKGFFEEKDLLKTILIYLILCLFVFAPALTKPLPSPDSVSQAYPTYSFERSYILKHGTLPFWFPYICGGIPYIEGWHSNHFTDILVYMFSIPLSIGYRAMLFVLLSGIFAYLFFKYSGFPKIVSFIAGAVYLLSGNAITYVTIGHFGKVVNLAFLPLAFLFLTKGIESKKIWWFIFAGLPIGAMFRGHPQIFYYNLMLITAWFFFSIIKKYIEEKNLSSLLFFLGGYVLTGFFSLLVCIDNLSTQLILVKMTSRGVQHDPVSQWQFATSWSLHPLELLCYILPGLFGLKDQTYMGWRPFVSTTDYVGVIVFIIAIFGIIKKWKDHSIKFLTILTLLAVFFGFGSFFEPYFRLFYNYVPMIKSFRVPSSIYIPVTFFIVWFFAYGLNFFIENSISEIKEEQKKIQWLIFAFPIIALLITFFVNSSYYTDLLRGNLLAKIDINTLYNQYGKPQVDAYIANLISSVKNIAKSGLKPLWIFSIISAFFIFLKSSNKIKSSLFFFVIFCITAIDLMIIDRKFVETVDISAYERLSRPDDVVRFIKSDKSEKFRIISFPPQIDNESNKWSFFEIESAFGYNPVGLKNYEDIQKAGLLFDLKFLGLFNVKYLLFSKPVEDPRLKLVYQGSKLIYQNLLFLPRITFPQNVKVVTNINERLSYLKSPEYKPFNETVLSEEPDFETRIFPEDMSLSVNVIKWKEDIIHLKVNSEKDCLLRLSEVYYPKWQCFINGKNTKIYQADNLFRAVYIKAGENDVVFKYKNDGRYIVTTLVAFITIIFLIVLIIYRKRILNLD